MWISVGVFVGMMWIRSFWWGKDSSPADAAFFATVFWITTGAIEFVSMIRRERAL